MKNKKDSSPPYSCTGNILDGLFSDDENSSNKKVRQLDDSPGRFVKRKINFYVPETGLSQKTNNEVNISSPIRPSPFHKPSSVKTPETIITQKTNKDNNKSVRSSPFRKPSPFRLPEIELTQKSNTNISSPVRSSPFREPSPFKIPENYFQSFQPEEEDVSILLKDSAYIDELLKDLTQAQPLLETECDESELVEEIVEEVFTAQPGASAEVSFSTQKALSANQSTNSTQENATSSAMKEPFNLSLSGHSVYSQQVRQGILPEYCDSERSSPDIYNKSNAMLDVNSSQAEENPNFPGLKTPTVPNLANPLTQYRPTIDMSPEAWMEMNLKIVHRILKKSRCVAHVDLDCFYAQVEQVRLDISGDIPLAVQQWNGLLAINYAARKFGISRMETPAEAKIKCPELMLVHVPTYGQGDTEYKYNKNPNFATHKASLAPYRDASNKIFDIFRSFTHKVQKGGTDEAFIDLTDLVNERILKDCRATGNFSPETLSPLDWKGWGHVIEASREGSDLEITDQVEQPEYTTDFATRYWRSRQLLAGAKIASRIRATVFSLLGYTCGAGIAHNKHMAKLCSAQNKPNQQSILLEEATLPFLKNFPVTKIRFMAGKLGHRTAHHFGETCGELWKYSLKDFQDVLGRKDGAFVFDICRGINHKPVKPVQPMKSLMSGKSLIPPCTDMETLKNWLNVLGTELVFRLQDAAEDSRWPKSLAIGIYSPNSGYLQRVGLIPSHSSLQVDPNLLASRAFDLCQGFSDDELFPCKFLCLSAIGLEDSITKTNTTITDFFQVKELPVTELSNKPKSIAKSSLINSEAPACNLPPQIQGGSVTNSEPVFVQPQNPIIVDRTDSNLSVEFVSASACNEVVDLLTQPTDLTDTSLNQVSSDNASAKILCSICEKLVLMSESQAHQDFHVAQSLQTKFDREHINFPASRSQPAKQTTKPKSRRGRPPLHKKVDLSKHANLLGIPEKQTTLTSMFLPRSISTGSTAVAKNNQNISNTRGIIPHPSGRITDGLNMEWSDLYTTTS